MFLVRVMASFFLLGVGVLAGVEEPDRSLLKHLRPDLVGTDREGYLWVYDRREDLVEVLTLRGKKRTEVEAGHPRHLDVHHRWGLVGIYDFGSTLRVIPLDGRERTAINLADEAARVAWVDSDTVAVAPERAGHRVALWDVEEQSLVRTLGDEPPISKGPGAVFAHSFDIEVDPLNGTIWTLDSLSGEVIVFRRNGTVLRSLTIHNPQLAELESWRREVDRSARQEGEGQRPTIWSLRLEVDSEGRGWIVRECTEDGAAVVVEILDEGEPVTREITTDCCSKSFALHEQHIIFARSRRAPGGGCFDVRRLTRKRRLR